jgi:small redox-active disulfide protein 2
MKIEVLGSGCKKCDALEQVARQAVAKLGIDAEVEHVTDIETIMAYGVMSTPALVVDGQVRIAGRVAKLDEVVRVLERAGA